MSEESFRAARDYAARGWHVIPLVPGGKAPAGKLVVNGKDDATDDDDTIRHWWSVEPNAGVAIVVEPSGILVVDVDDRNDGFATLAELGARLGELPPTVTARTGGGGVHYLFRAPSAGVDLRGKLGRGIDLIRRGYIVAAPSTHPSGGAYRWQEGRGPDDVPLADLPAAWLEAATRPPAPAAPPRAPAPPAAGEDFYAALASLDQGVVLETLSGSWLVGGQTIECRPSSRDKRTIVVDGKPTGGWIDARGTIGHTSTGASGRPDGGPTAAIWCRYYGHTDADIRRGLIELVPELRHFGEPRPRLAHREPPPWLDARDEAEVVNVDAAGGGADGAHPNAPGEPSPPPRPDRILVKDASALALARLVYDELGLDDLGRQTIVRYLGDWWRYRDGHHHLIESEVARALVWRTLDRVDVQSEAKDGAPVIERLVVKSWRVSEVLDAMTSIADRVDSVADLPAPLPGYDGPAPSRVAVVRNGLLDLTTETLYPPTPRLFATSGAAVDYDPAAECPAWLAFLEQIFTDEDCGDDGVDRDSIRLLQQVFGWFVSGDTTRHAIPLLFGPARSGKSTIGTILRELLGPGNVASPSLSSLGEPRFGMVPLIGKSAALVPDARIGRHSDQAQIANLLLAVSGQDTVTIDRKNRDAISVRLRARVMIVTNELPQIGDSSGALASRFLVIQTRLSFLGREDQGLEQRLRAELPGILRWAIAGWHDLVANRWVRPARSQEVLDELDRLGSPERAFAEERLVFSPDADVAVKDLYGEWKRWCSETGRDNPGTEQSFGKRFRAAFPKLKIAQRGARGAQTRRYLGVQLRGPL